jgi:hypothetical protein
VDSQERQAEGTKDGQPAPLTRAELRTPRAAAIAGIVFSVLLIVSLWLLRLSIPSDAREAGAWLTTSTRRVSLALGLIPISGVAFMWFLGVLRDRLGPREDRFFATVFLGSGLLFLGMLFVAAAATGGLVLAYADTPLALPLGSAFAFARAFTYAIMHVYAFKMAAVFMITTSTIAWRTAFAARWVAILGYASAAAILVGSSYLDWVLLTFPAWVLLVSIHILLDNPRPARRTHSGAS